MFVIVVISCADRLPELITASSRSRSSVLNFTTYLFAPTGEGILDKREAGGKFDAVNPRI